MTVTGPVAPQDLGVVMPHEYCLVGEWILREAEYGMNTNLADLTFELKNLGKIQQFPLVKVQATIRTALTLLFPFHACIYFF